jgi:hypothetical protein
LTHRNLSTSLKTTARRLLTVSRLLAPPPEPEDPCPHCGAADLADPGDAEHLTLLAWTAKELLRRVRQRTDRSDHR